MKQLWSIYHKEIPDFLREFAQTPPLQRLRNVGMNCGCEYTNFPRFRGLGPYSRYDHSMGAALIVWHFTGSMEQSLAALFHDVTTPVFAHVVDFLNGDHLKQESTEDGVAECLAASSEVCRLLEKYGVDLDAVSDYHRYPIADNDSPALSSDRLEYTMGNLLNYGFASLAEIRAMYDDLTVGTDEASRPELVFATPELAVTFTSLALKNSRIYVADEDRFAMEMLAQLLRRAMERYVISEADLMGTEPEIIRLLEQDDESTAAWHRFCGYSMLLQADERPSDGEWISVNAKKRWIDPFAEGLGRVSVWDERTAKEIAAFCAMDFSHWLSAE